jgi:hypothetical protein
LIEKTKTENVRFPTVVFSQFTNWFWAVFFKQNCFTFLFMFWLKNVPQYVYMGLHIFTLVYVFKPQKKIDFH